MGNTKTKLTKVLRVWTPYHCPEKDYTFLTNAITRATEVALERQCEAMVEMAWVDGQGVSQKGIIVARIKGAKFNEYGAIAK
tara:strand:- start:8883 stop:9128 length:246 start_codon:yes stop_codon:yes gene_type:complete